MRKQLELIVGKSDRTYGKHVLLNKVLGREAGVLPILANERNWIDYPWCIVDLCAGDGVDTRQSGSCSPAIIGKHARAINSKREDGARVLFVERGDAQYQSLANSLYVKGFKVFHGSNTNDFVSQFINSNTSSNSPVFLHNDPNHIEDWQLSPELVRYFANHRKLLTTFSTLGCNVGGLKRLSADVRRQWFKRVDDLCCIIPAWHDALLITLNGDNSQWAYLITGPMKWMNEGKYQSDAQSAFTKWSRGVSMARLKTQRDEWRSLITHLFMTHAELTTHEEEKEWHEYANSV